MDNLIHTTLEAIYDPKTGLQFVEPVQLDKPVRVLVTIIDTPIIAKPLESNLLSKLISIHQIAYSTHRSEAEIDNYIQAYRDSRD